LSFNHDGQARRVRDGFARFSLAEQAALLALLATL
jgi:hypothetical protein